MTKSLCDRCYAPGACCKRLVLSTPEGAVTNWEGDDPRTPLKSLNLPFTPLEVAETWVDPESGRKFEQWWFKCPELTPTGRCGIYKNRPQLCRDFAPASDSLCVHWGGAEGGGA